MEHQWMNQEVILQMWQVARTDQKLCNLRDTNWVIAQQTNLVLKHMVDWLKQHKDDRRLLNDYLKNYTTDSEWRYYTHCQTDFILRNNLLYLKVNPPKSDKTVLVFEVPAC